MTVTLTKSASKFDTHSASVLVSYDSEIISQKIQVETLFKHGERVTAYHYPEKEELSIRIDSSDGQAQAKGEQLRELGERSFFGYEFFDTDIISIPDLLARVDVMLEISQGEEGRIILKANCEKFCLEIWFEDADNGVPRRIVFERNLENAKMFEMVFFKLDVIEYQRVEGVLVPKEMNISRKQMITEKELVINPVDFTAQNVVEKGSRSGARRVEEIKAKWSNVTFSQKKFPGQMMGSLFEIPDGTPASRRDAPQIEYIWFNGNIVPKTNEVMLAIARDGHKFMPGPNEPRFWLMAIGILMIVVALGKMLYDIIQKNNQGQRGGGQ